MVASGQHSMPEALMLSGMLLQADLNALHERDPEFYAYLKQTDSGLLDFTLPGSDEEEDEVEDEVEDAQASEEVRHVHSKERVPLSELD